MLETACQSISSAHTRHVGTQSYGPSEPSQVEILWNVPARPHIELGEVRATANTSVATAQLEAALRREAGELGADAIVVWQDGFRSGGNGRDVTVVGAAIKYP